MEFKQLSEKEKNLAIVFKYDLLRDKAIFLQNHGVKACTNNDNFNLKGITLSKNIIDLIERGLPQIIDYKGLTFDRALEGLTIRGFYYFMYLFHFEQTRQLATLFDNYTIDHILLKNTITGDKMWLVNKVEKISKEEIDKFSTYK